MSQTRNLVEKLFKKSDDGSFLSLDELTHIERIPTISPSVNYMLQGGIVPSKFYAFAGPPSGGKSMFAVSCCAEFLKRDKEAVVIWFDVERSFTKHWLDIYLSQLGMEELKYRFIVKEVSTGAEIFDYYANEIVDSIQSGLKVAACVVDSVQSITPPAEFMADSSEKAVMAALARYLPQGMRKIIAPARLHETTWFFICQVRDNMDMFTQALQKYIVPGGKAFHHFIDGLIMFEPIGRKDGKIFSVEKGIDGKEVQIGHYVLAKMQNKCRVGVPNRVGKFKFLYASGIVDTHEELFELAILKNIIIAKGNFWCYQDITIGNGKTAAMESFRLNVDLMEKILKDIKALY